MGEEQGEVAAFFGEQGDGRVGAGPDGAYMGLKPAAELESVELSLIEQQTQQLFTIHFTNPLKTRRTWSQAAD
jgi:hypothetical protein